MAESVDALVSNTSGATHPGSIPGLGTRKKSNDSYYRLTFFYFQENPPKTSHFHSVTICHSWYAKKSA